MERYRGSYVYRVVSIGRDFLFGIFTTRAEAERLRDRINEWSGYPDTNAFGAEVARTPLLSQAEDLPDWEYYGHKYPARSRDLSKEGHSDG